MRVYVQGSFDILHSGHINLLKRSKKLGEVVVALLSDEAYEKYRGHKPVQTFEERRSVLMATKYVDLVFKSDNGKTAHELELVKPNFVAVGTDWVSKDIYKQYGITKEWLEGKGITLLFFPYTEGVSSTEIKERVKK